MSAPATSTRVLAPVPMSGPHITDLEMSSVAAVLSSGCLSIGPQLEEFERRIARLIGVRHAIGVSSGTAGLHLATIAAGVETGDLVITTPFSFVASANCILYERGIPIFVDVDPVTGNLDPGLVAEAVRDLRTGGAARQRWLPPALRHRDSGVGRLKAILPVHAFGQPADMDPIVETARVHALTVIEDACEAIGAAYKRRYAGGIGDVGVFAFYPNKQVTTGEGGIIVTNNDDWAAQFRSLRNQGRDTMDEWLRHDRLGYNYRMSELNAALGVAQLSRFDALLAARDRVAKCYFEHLSELQWLEVPAVVSNTTRMSWFSYVVRVRENVNRDSVMDYLARRGIPTRPYFSPIHLQSFYAQKFGYKPGAFPIAERLGNSCLALPFSGTLTVDQIERVCSAIAGVFEEI
jgi:dTDP-4-amino-4,6-dideoxygalactose transaminase